MALLNYKKREINAKIVYYGPGLSGKTTNIQHIHTKLRPDHRGKLMTLATQTDRTLFFDFLPVELGQIRGLKTRFQIFTVPGQVFYNATRKLVLKNVDGVVFVADSDPAHVADNIESIKNLEQNLKFHNKDINDIPLIIQYNKRDLPNALSIEELESKVNLYGAGHTEASAGEGIGVLETLTAISKLVLQRLRDTQNVVHVEDEDSPDLSTPTPDLAAPAEEEAPDEPAPEATPDAETDDIMDDSVDIEIDESVEDVGEDTDEIMLEPEGRAEGDEDDIMLEPEGQAEDDEHDILLEPEDPEQSLSADAVQDDEEEDLPDEILLGDDQSDPEQDVLTREEEQPEDLLLEHSDEPATASSTPTISFDRVISARPNGSSGLSVDLAFTAGDEEITVNLDIDIRTKTVSKA